VYTKNHASAYTSPTVINLYIQKKCTAGHYTGPFSHSCLEYLIGPFRSSPLGLVLKSSTSGELRLIQDIFYPCGDPDRPSINDGIDSDNFPCKWGTFAKVLLLVMDAPAGMKPPL